nr:hypothetical protein [Clostridia bacterium]
MSNIKIGFAEYDLIPKNGKRVSLAGQFYERISEYVETPITVTAMAVESCGQQMVICSCDLVSVAISLINNVRERIASALTDLDPMNVIVNATHVHTGPVYTRKSSMDSNSALTVLRRYLPEDAEYKAKVTADDSVMTASEADVFLADAIANAALRAWTHRRDALVANEFARAVVGHCRRVAYDDGSAKMWGDTDHANFSELEGGNDNGVELMYIFDESEKLTGIVANVSCPAQVLEHRSFVSSDYWGKLKIRLRERFGNDLFVLGLCSAAGDQCPRDMIRWVEPETPISDPNIDRDNPTVRRADMSMFDIDGTWEIARRLYNEIEYKYENAKKTKHDIDIFIHKVEKLSLPLRRVTISDYEDAKSKLEEYIRNAGSREYNFRDSAKTHIWAGTMARYEYQQSCNIVPMELHTVRLGDIAIATNPFELFLDYGNKIRARSKASQTFLIQLACDCLSYLPTEKAEKGSHYSAYVSSGYVGHEGGDMLVRCTLESVNEMWK